MFWINTNKEGLIFLDTEFDSGVLVQVAAIALIKTEVPYVYAIDSSINIFIKEELSFFFKKNSCITQEFLNLKGMKREDAAEVTKAFLRGKEDFLFVGHGIHQDLLYLSSLIGKKDFNYFCTYEFAKKLNLPQLKLYDIVKLNGIFPYLGHDAYEDCKSTIYAYQVLMEMKKEEEK